MAKNNIPTTDYARQQENIRKARGNPNKNIHHKRKNSNYGGVDATAQKAAGQTPAQRRRRETVFDMTPAGRIVFFALLAVMLVLMAMGMSSAYQGNALVSNGASLSAGVTCCYLAYVGLHNKARKKAATTFQSGLIVVLGIVAVALVYVLRRIINTTRGRGDCGCGCGKSCKCKKNQ